MQIGVNCNGQEATTQPTAEFAFHFLIIEHS